MTSDARRRLERRRYVTRPRGTLAESVEVDDSAVVSASALASYGPRAAEQCVSTSESEMEKIQFADLNEDKPASLREFNPQLQRCAEVSRILRVFAAYTDKYAGMGVRPPVKPEPNLLSNIGPSITSNGGVVVTLQASKPLRTRKQSVRQRLEITNTNTSCL
jgi:hypothetical protein